MVVGIFANPVFKNPGRYASSVSTSDVTKILSKLPFDTKINIFPHCAYRTRNSCSFLSIESCTLRFRFSTYIKTDQNNWREL